MRKKYLSICDMFFILRLLLRDMCDNSGLTLFQLRDFIKFTDVRSQYSDGSGSKTFGPGRVGSGQVIFLLLGSQIFNFFFSDHKNLIRSGQKKIRVSKTGRPLIYNRS